MFKFYCKSFICIIVFLTPAKAQVQISPKFSVDGVVKALISRNDTLIVAGRFNNVGLYTGGGAILTTNTTAPNLKLPKLIGSVNCSTPDGNGGYYIYGNYRKEEEESSPGFRIEHILPNLTIDPGFSLAVNGRIRQLLFDRSILYIGGSYIESIGGQQAGDLAGYDVLSKKLVTWLPIIKRTYLGGVSVLKIRENRLYIAGGFTEVGSEQRKSLAAIELYSGNVKKWNPSISGINAIEFYRDKIILGGVFNDATLMNHACAFVDSSAGQNLDYIFNSSNLYSAAGVQKMVLRGDTLFTYTSGTVDTRITALDLARNNTILWKKYFNMGAVASEIKISSNFLFVAGSAFEDIYMTNLPNNNIQNKERSIKGIVKLDYQTGQLIDWHPNPVGLIDAQIASMSISGESMFIGGSFSHLHGEERRGVIMVDVKKEEVLPFSIDIDVDFNVWDVNALKVIDSTLYIAGNFSRVNGKEFSSSVLAYNFKTGQLLPWHPIKLGTARVIEATNKYVFLGGDLIETGASANRKSLVAIDRKTGLLADWSPNPDSYPESSSLHVAHGKLYVGGNFKLISGQRRTNLVAYESETLQLLNWQPQVNQITAISSTDTAILVCDYTKSLVNATTYNRILSIHRNSEKVVNILTGDLPISSMGEGIVMTTKGKYIILGGRFSVGQCSNISIIDLLNKKVLKSTEFCLLFPSWTDRVNAITFHGNDLIIGGNFIGLNSQSITTFIDRIRFPTGFFDLNETFDYYPRIGGNGGDVTVVFSGNQFLKGTKIKLSAPGLPDIAVPDSSITYPEANRMHVRFDLRQKAIGDYDIIITTSTGSQFSSTKGFKIAPIEKPDLMVQLVGPDIIRMRAGGSYVLQVKNTGNCDAIGVPLFLYISANTKARFLNKYAGINGERIDTLKYAIIDSAIGFPNKCKMYWLLIPRITAGTSKNIQLILSPLVPNEDVRITVAINNPLFASPLPPAEQACFDAIGGFALDLFVQSFKEPFNPFYSCYANTIKTFNTIFNSVYYNKALDDIELADFGANISGALINCTTSVIPEALILKRIYEVYDFMLSNGVNGTKIVLTCKDIFDPSTNKRSKRVRTINSFDPNDKVGIGQSARHHITGYEPLQYGIRFENLATASAAAQVVRIVDTLDHEKLDLSTFQLNFFRIGSKYINFLPGQKKCIELVDLRPQTNLLVQISAELDEATGTFTTIYSSIDPTTNQLTTDPILGFLPANRQSPEGEGSIYYTINAKKELANKTTITNKALIYFDSNPPIATPFWRNIIDKLTPESSVSSLPVFTTDTTFTLQWQGTDGESGIEKYSIYYSVNGKPYKSLIQNTIKTSYRFTGRVDSTYSFYSVAIDSVGNIERTPSTYDAKTTISLVTATEPLYESRFIIYPNPNDSEFTLEVPLGDHVENLSLVDLLGRHIDLHITPLPNRVYKIQSKQLATGAYWLYITSKGKKIVRKLIIN